MKLQCFLLFFFFRTWSYSHICFSFFSLCPSLLFNLASLCFPFPFSSIFYVVSVFYVFVNHFLVANSMCFCGSLRHGQWFGVLSYMILYREKSLLSEISCPHVTHAIPCYSFRKCSAWIPARESPPGMPLSMITSRILGICRDSFPLHPECYCKFGKSSTRFCSGESVLSFNLY